MAYNDNRDILKWKRTIDSIQSNEQSVDEPMAEGTWSVPETPEQVKKLTNLLKNPLDAETALDELYDVFGDDELFDDLEVMKRDEPETDVRHVVIRRLKDMNFIKEVREHNKPIKEEECTACNGTGWDKTVTSDEDDRGCDECGGTGEIEESVNEGGVHRLRVDQQTHVNAEHHDVIISSNDMGIIVDIYDKEHENIDTNTYWNDDVTRDEEEDSSTV
jgi:hypothetical protein